MRVVLDASAAVAAVLGRDPAPSLLQILESASVVLAPDLFASEVANALWKYVSAHEIRSDEAADALEHSMKLIDRFVPIAPLAQEALREATIRGHPVYDLCYAVTARREGCSVLTIDTRLQKLLDKMSIERVLVRRSHA